MILRNDSGIVDSICVRTQQIDQVLFSFQINHIKFFPIGKVSVQYHDFRVDQAFSRGEEVCQIFVFARLSYKKIKFC